MGNLGDSSKQKVIEYLSCYSWWQIWKLIKLNVWYQNEQKVKHQTKKTKIKGINRLYKCWNPWILQPQLEMMLTLKLELHCREVEKGFKKVIICLVVNQRHIRDLGKTFSCQLLGFLRNNLNDASSVVNSGLYFLRLTVVQDLLQSWCYSLFSFSLVFSLVLMKMITKSLRIKCILRGQAL